MSTLAAEYGPDNPRPWNPDGLSLHARRTAAHEPSGTARAVLAYSSTRPAGLSEAAAIRTVADLLGVPASSVERERATAREVAAEAVRAGTCSGAMHHTTPNEWADYA